MSFSRSTSAPPRASFLETHVVTDESAVFKTPTNPPPPSASSSAESSTQTDPELWSEEDELASMSMEQREAEVARRRAKESELELRKRAAARKIDFEKEAGGEKVQVRRWEIAANKGDLLVH